MPSFRDGSTNILALNNPGVYVDQILPNSNIVGVSTNIEAFVGVASWGPVDTVSYFSTPDDFASIGGVAQVRQFDIASQVLAAYQQGSSIAFASVRVTDGTDAAATAEIPSSAGSFTALYTGTRGNQISVMFQNTALAGAYAAVISFPGRMPERFDNILTALSGFTTVPGTGFTSVPSLSLSAPAQAGGIQAVAQATLAAVSATLAAGGTGHAVNDVVTLGAGVTVKVTGVNAGAITTAALVNPGSITSGTVPATVGNQVGTTGAGTGAQFTLVWGLGAPNVVTPGFGYPANTLTASIVGGGGTGGSYTAISSFWGALAYAIANGTTQRGKSSYVVFSPGASAAVPAVNTAYALSGGTDGANGVTVDSLVGVDISPRTGMYALRNSGFDCFTLCDCTDPTTWATQLSFAISESGLAVVATESGDTIANCVSTRASEGIDDPNIWIIEGDWPTFYDSQNGFTRLINPCAIALGLTGNLSPEQSPINKQLNAVIATETSQTGVLIADADESQAQSGGIDLIGQSVDLAEDYFTFLTGRNSSSNTAANGVEYTRLTNFLIKTLEKGGRSIVGRLQSIQPNDPTRTLALSTVNSILQNLASPAAGSGGYGMIDTFSCQCDLNNNPASLQSQGFLFLYATIRYLNVVRYFVIQLNGGGNVTVSVQTQAPSVNQFVQ